MFNKYIKRLNKNYIFILFLKYLTYLFEEYRLIKLGNSMINLVE